MGIYNFQPRFVPYVEDWTKTHTIRAERANPDSVGHVLHLYTGLRHKGARLIMRARCVRTDFVRIEEGRGGLLRIRIGASVGLNDFPAPYGEGQLHGGFVELSQDEADALAWRDGFRPPEGRKGAFELMSRFWRMTHALPFEGQILHWDPKTARELKRPGDPELPSRCTDCHVLLGRQHRPSCHRQGLVTPASDYLTRKVAV